MKKQYSYNVNGVILSTREAARELQRTFRKPTPDGGLTNGPRIVQQLIVQRVVR